jgi:site-specific DNA recombinase
VSSLRFGGYVRVSRVGGREGDSFLSPTLQRERLQAWCEVQGHDLVSIAEDLDVSGASTSREQLEALVEAIEAGRLDGVVVATLDRFGRSLPYAIALIDRINRAGGHFVSVADGFDTRTPYRSSSRRSQ